MNDPLLPGDTITLLTPGDDIEAMARELFDAWGDYNPGETLETCRADLVGGLGADVAIPKTFVYRRGGQAVAWISIIAVDIVERPDLGPWLANLTVLPEHRGQGIARRLVRHLMNYAQDVTDTLYLYTDNLQAAYEKLGWRAVEEMNIGDKPVMLMVWDARHPEQA